MREAVIVSAVRTPIGNFNGTLSTFGATQLGALVIEEAIKRAGIAKEGVNEVNMGIVLPCGYGQNPARQAAIKAGLPWEAESLTINKVCGSGLKAVMLAAQAIQIGDADVAVAGGMESMSQAPYYLEKARFGYRLGNATLHDHMLHDGLWDMVNDFHMGMSNELCSEKYNASRQDQDRYAAESYRRALAAMQAGRFQMPQGDFLRESCPVETSFQGRWSHHPGQRFNYQRRRCRRGGDGKRKGGGHGLSNLGDHWRPSLCGDRCQVPACCPHPGDSKVP
jgi:acetyl-CoA C-acetyltransferase